MNPPDCWLGIPYVIWSAVIASVLALGGVLISLRINSNNLKSQLEHDSLERDKERKADLRKEVYLNVAEELTKAQGFLAALPQADLSDPKQASGLSGFFSAATKLQLVCEPDTSLLVGELVGAYGELLFQLLGRVDPIHSVRNDIAIRSKHYDSYQAEIERVMAAITEINESGKPDPVRAQGLMRSFEFYQKQSSQITQERTDLYQQQNELHAVFLRDRLVDTRKIIPLQMKVMFAIRTELNLQNDRDQAQQQMDTLMKQMTTQVDTFLERLRAE